MTSDTLGVEAVCDTVLKALEQLTKIAFENPAPNPYTPRLLMNIQALERYVRLARYEALLPKGVDRGGKEEDGVSQSQPCGEASAVAEVFAGLDAEPSGPVWIHTDQKCWATYTTDPKGFCSVCNREGRCWALRWPRKAKALGASS